MISALEKIRSELVGKLRELRAVEPRTREVSIAITKLQEAIMWIDAAQQEPA